MSESETRDCWIIAKKRAKKKLWIPKSNSGYYDNIYSNREDAISGIGWKDAALWDVYRVKMTLEKPNE